MPKTRALLGHAWTGVAGRDASAVLLLSADAFDDAGGGSLFSRSQKPPLLHSSSQKHNTARRPSLLGGGAGNTEWKETLGTLRVATPAEEEDGESYDADGAAASFDHAFGEDDDDGGEDGGIEASFDLEAPDEEEDEDEGVSASWAVEDDDDDEDDFTFIPDDATDGSDGGSKGGGRRASNSGVVEEILFSLDAGWGLEAVDPGAAVEPVVAAAPAQTSPGFKRRQTPADAADREAAPAPHPKSALGSIPPHVLASLTAAQARASDDAAGATPNARRRAAAERRVHRRLRIIGGASAGRRLLSGAGETTRPMMDKVRAAVFDALSAGGPAGPGRLPASASWLDLFAGTGAVGLEALSRGAAAATFVEMDPWVSAAVLRPNLESCAGDWVEEGEGGGDVSFPSSSSRTATPVLGRAEDFIARHPGPPFDYVSVCPPYEKVSYGELMTGLADAVGRVLHPHSFVIVEYPRLAERDMPAALGPLARLRDRKYGRTLLAIYGPP
jgi:16S rRNA (guanine(966)-N(2))-methyltransferase RsmD